MKLIKHDSEGGTIDLLHSMYPSVAHSVVGPFRYPTDKTETVFGYVMKGYATLHHSKGYYEIQEGDYFCAPGSRIKDIVAPGDSRIALFIRYGFLGQFGIGTVEEQGRVTYIDGCTDSLLCYPPRQGDPSMSSLHFPRNVDQSFHIHPTVRFGAVVRGQGYACFEGKEMTLEKGDVFCIEPLELHRFRTENDNEMVVVAYHPDGDWGPTDETHPMINRTYMQLSGNK